MVFQDKHILIPILVQKKVILLAMIYSLIMRLLRIQLLSITEIILVILDNITLDYLWASFLRIIT